MSDFEPVICIYQYLQLQWFHCFTFESIVQYNSRLLNISKLTRAATAITGHYSIVSSYSQRILKFLGVLGGLVVSVSRGSEFSSWPGQKIGSRYLFHLCSCPIQLYTDCSLSVGR